MSDSMCLAELPAGLALLEYPTASMAVFTKEQKSLKFHDKGLEMFSGKGQPTSWLSGSLFLFPAWLRNGLLRRWVASTQKRKVDITFSFKT